MDPIFSYASHAVDTRYAALPASATTAAKVFILDTIGVGIVGSSGPLAPELAQAQSKFGTGDDARVWSLGTRLPAAAAAQCNAYQIHNSEFDCVHEPAVAHVMSAVLPASIAHAERCGGITGRQLLEAVIVGVDIASSLGVAATSGLRFFRPATVGAFGATAAVGKLMGFDQARMVHALSIAYGQMSGTMQAHTEGSMLLAMQMGFNTRNAVVACDLAADGFEGPQNILEGPFGYFGLFESAGDPGAVAQDLGKIWRIEEVAHKPFPSGRATHGIVDGCLELQSRHSVSADHIAHITASVPPLVHHLVGRPPLERMETNYARLCAAYVAACALVKGHVKFDDFSDDAYGDRRVQSLAQKITVDINDRGDPNALTPVSVSMTLADGQHHAIELADVYGHPARPMSRQAQIEKFMANCALAHAPISPAAGERLIETIDSLDTLDDVRNLVDLMVAA